MHRNKYQAYPYALWLAVFTIIPMIIVVYFAFTDGSGRFTLEDALTFDQVRECLDQGTLSQHLFPTDTVFSDLPAVFLNEAGDIRASHGAFFTEKHLADIKYNVDRTISYINSKRKDLDDYYLAFFKLNTKLPFLFSDKLGDYLTWSNLWPESNRYIMKNTAQPLRTRLIQWVASKRLYPLIRIYFSVVYKVVYRKLYN